MTDYTAVTMNELSLQCEQIMRKTSLKGWIWLDTFNLMKPQTIVGMRARKPEGCMPMIYTHFRHEIPAQEGWG